MHSLNFLLLILLFWVPFPSFSQSILSVKDSKHIVFSYGSCNKPEFDRRGRIFLEILKHNPDVWVWIGDAYYIAKNNIEHVQHLSDRVLSTPGYKRLKFEVPIIGIWDDHDFGPDNGGKHYPYKDRNREIFLNFLNEPLVSSRWYKEGLYDSYYIGGENLVKIIMLDNRYNKDPRLSFNSSGEMLGDEQWEWFERQLVDNPAKFTLVTSGIQILPDDRLYPEVWFTSHKERLISLIRKHKKSGVILLSGDVHYAEIMEYPCSERVGYTLYEFTSSGLTHFLSGTLMADVIDTAYPYTYSMPIQRYYGKNFGIIRFNFDNEDNPQAILEIRNIDNEIVLGKVVNYEELTFREDIIDMDSDCVENTGKIRRFLRHLFERYGDGNGLAIAVITVAIIAIILFFAIWFYRIYKRRKVYIYKRIKGKTRKHVNVMRNKSRRE